MILRQATIKYKGYDPLKLKPKSHKRICCSCDECGRVRWLSKQSYRGLCGSCARVNLNGQNNHMYGRHHSEETKKLMSNVRIGKYVGEDAPNYGHKHSEETKDKMSESHHDVNGFNNPNWKGGLSLRDHVLSEYKCIKLNSRFNNSEFHHITKSIGIFIPKTLHRHFYHNLKTGQGIGEMNILAIQFMNGEL